MYTAGKKASAGALTKYAIRTATYPKHAIERAAYASHAVTVCHCALHATAEAIVIVGDGKKRTGFDRPAQHKRHCHTERRTRRTIARQC